MVTQKCFCRCYKFRKRTYSLDQGKSSVIMHFELAFFNLWNMRPSFPQTPELLPF
uniref:Uncharacterized protein n=1 Tax=Anguilla anguilla TaxID=7936 RepID=A0A0E9X317_ANGAN